jgi:hypothetical protein
MRRDKKKDRDSPPIFEEEHQLHCVVLFLLSVEHLGQAGHWITTRAGLDCHMTETATNESSVMDEKD